MFRSTRHLLQLSRCFHSSLRLEKRGPQNPGIARRAKLLRDGDKVPLEMFEEDPGKILMWSSFYQF